MNKPVISIVVTTYNHEKYIAECLDSLLAQKDCPEFEILVGNDCSTDKTSEILADYASKYSNIRAFQREENLGMQKNMKDLFNHCEGKYIAICDGDDYWDEYSLKKKYEALENDKNAPMVFTDISILDRTGKMTPHIPEIKSKLGNTITQINILEPINVITTSSCCMYRKEAVEKIPDSYYEGKNADWLFNLYIMDGSYSLFINEPLTVYRLHPGSVWASLPIREQAIRMYRACWDYNILFKNRLSEQFYNYAERRFDKAFNSLEQNIKDLKAENTELKKLLSDTQKENIELQTKIDNSHKFIYKDWKHLVFNIPGIRFKFKVKK